MRHYTLYVVVFAVLGVVTLYGIRFTAWNPNQAQDANELQGVSVELANEWINFYNSTGSYRYGARINVTNTGQSNLELSNLQISFTGEGRDKPWSGTCPTKDLVLAPGESKNINMNSQDVPTSLLGFVGASKPGEYLDLATTKKNLGLSIELEGTASSTGKSTAFKSTAKGLQTGSASSSELAYARDTSHLGLTADYLKRWLDTFSYLPVQDFFKYQAVQRGVVGTGKISLIVVRRSILTSYQSVSLGIEDVRTLTVTGTNPQKVYYLIDRGYGFESYLKDVELSDGESVYFYGDAYDYLAQDGLHYEMMFPSDISGTQIRDPLEIAKSLIVSRVGEEYYEKYFSDPVVEYNPGQGNATHYISFTYHITIGNYTGSQPIYLYFDPYWNLAYGAKYLPAAGNLQPFKVTEEQAKEIAVKAGISVEPYGIWANIGNGGIARDRTTAYQGKYVWWVGTWIDPPDANPRRNMYAVIDPNTGELYAVEQGGVCNIESVFGP